MAWADVIALLVIGRLCEPSSELHMAEQWYRTTALEELLGIHPEQVCDERLYRALDHLLAHKAAIEVRLVKRFARQIEDRIDWRHIRDDIEVKLCSVEDVAAMAVARRTWACAARDSDGVLAHSRRRYCAAAGRCDPS